MIAFPQSLHALRATPRVPTRGIGEKQLPNAVGLLVARSTVLTSLDPGISKTPDRDRGNLSSRIRQPNPTTIS